MCERQILRKKTWNELKAVVNLALLLFSNFYFSCILNSRTLRKPREKQTFANIGFHLMKNYFGIKAFGRSHRASIYFWEVHRSHLVENTFLSHNEVKHFVGICRALRRGRICRTRTGQS